jgi:hypothetical protein
MTCEVKALSADYQNQTRRREGRPTTHVDSLHPADTDAEAAETRRVGRVRVAADH